MSEQLSIQLLGAVANGDEQQIKDLLNEGADISCHDEATPLHLAARMGNLDVVRLLIEKGANVNHKDGYGQTPLMRASRKGQRAVVQVLLDHNADVNVVSTDDDGATALHFASEEGKTEVVKLLLAKGVDVTIKNNDGETAADLARRPEIRELINNHNSNQ